jgi:TRAP-type C4-dicarboxylate transport system permease small subunit
LRLLAALSLVPRAALVLLMATLLVDMMLGVFFRYVVGRALFWSEEVGTLSLVWLTFIGGAVGVRRGSHFAIHLFVDLLGATARRVVHGATALLIALLGGTLAVFGWRLVQANATSETPALGISLGVLYTAPVVGGLLMICYACALAVDAARGRMVAPGDAGHRAAPPS